MADKRYSVDDILNEYSGIGKKADNSESDKVTMHNTDIFSKIIGTEQENADIGETEPLPVQDDHADGGNDENSDGFTEKYDKLFGSVAEIIEKNSAADDAEPAPKPDRSFSEKYEQGDIYNDAAAEEERRRKLRRRHRVSDEDMKRAGLFSFGVRKEQDDEEEENVPVQAAVSTAPKQSDDPFDKYAAIAEDTPDDGEEVQQDFAARKNIDDILAEYDAHDTKKKTVGENTRHRGLTDFFTKIIPDGDGENPGNTELLDGMRKMKKERVSRTQHINPVERKSISDIELNIDDNKILRDTAQIDIDTENSEEAKLNALRERRSKKIRDFVLVGDEEESPEEENEPEQRTIEDYESFDDAPSIAADIAQLKKSLVIRMAVLIVCLLAGLYIAVSNDTELLPAAGLLNKRTQTESYLFANLIVGLAAVVSSYTVISCGLSKLLSMKSDCDTFCAAALVSSLVSALVMFGNTNLIKGSIVHIYVAAAICALIFNTAGKLLIVSRTQRSFRFVSGGSDKYALFCVSDEERAQDFTRGALRDFPVLSSMKKTEFLTDFLKTSYASDSTDRFCRLFTPIVLVSAVIVALLAGVTARAQYGASGLYVGLSAFTGCVSLCSMFSMMLVVNLPMARASKKNSELQGAVLGYEAIDEFADTNSILYDAAELFPQGSVNLAAIKVFSETRIDEAIVEAASLTSQSGSILKNMFYDIIAGKTELLNPVESYIFEDSMGLCGWINNKRVLLGNRELMINHSIEGIPAASKEKEYTGGGKFAVYLSISGELSAMFIVELTPSIEVKQALSNLHRDGVYSVIRTVDSLVTINNLSELFDISPEYIKLLPFRMQSEFEETVAYQPRTKTTLACSGRFAAFASLILSCRSMKGTVSVGIAIEAVAVLLGILICLAMVILKSFSELTVLVTIIYNLVFTAILLVFQMFRRN